MNNFWRIGVTVVTVLAILTLLGCSSPQQKAQQLFNNAQYQELIEKYPDADPALVAQAKDSLAAPLFNEGNYQGVIEQYPESAFAEQAKAKIAEAEMAQKETDAGALLATAAQEKDKAKQGEIYQKVCNDYPGTQAAAKAMEMMSPKK